MNIVEQIIAAYGGMDKALEALELQDPQAIHNWKRRGVPYTKISKIHEDTKIPLADLFSRNSGEAAA